MSSPPGAALLPRVFMPGRGLLLGWQPKPPPQRPAPVSPDLTDRDTIVRMKDYDVFANRDGGGPNHAYVELVNPKTGETWIARGGPDREGAAFVPHFVSGDLSITSEVKPSVKSKDSPQARREKQINLVDSTVLRGVSQADAVRRAQAFSNGVNARRYPYLPRYNSNSFAYSLYGDMTGRRPPIGEHWGATRTLSPVPLRPREELQRGEMLPFPGF